MQAPTTKFLKLYKCRLPITKAKKNDLMTLLKNGVISSEYSTFYESLPVDDVTKDYLPARDILDPDTDDKAFDANNIQNISASHSEVSFDDLGHGECQSPTLTVQQIQVNQTASCQNESTTATNRPKQNTGKSRKPDVLCESIKTENRKKLTRTSCAAAAQQTQVYKTTSCQNEPISATNRPK